MENRIPPKEQNKEGTLRLEVFQDKISQKSPSTSDEIGFYEQKRLFLKSII